MEGKGREGTARLFCGRGRPKGFSVAAKGVSQHMLPNNKLVYDVGRLDKMGVLCSNNKIVDLEWNDYYCRHKYDK